MSESHPGQFRPDTATSGRIRPPPADFQFFLFQNKHFFCGILLVKITIVQMIWNLRKSPLINGILSWIINSILRFSPLSFNDRFHDFWHAINELLTVFNRPCVPNMFERILPHVHCSLMVGIFFTPLQILLCFLKSLCELRFLRLTVMTSRGIAVFFTVLIN